MNERPAPLAAPPDPPRFCAACGTALAEGAEFCSKCGTRVGVAPVPQPATRPQPSIALASTAYELASFWRRLGASLIDGVVWSFVTWPLQFGFQFAVMRSVPAGIGNGDELPSIVVFDWLASAFDSILFAIAFYSLAVALISIGFEAVGWTPGKLALGIRVLRSDGHAPGAVHGAARYIGKAVSGAVLFLGYLWAAWDPQRQAWHDKFADTYVVLVPASGISAPSGPRPLAISTAARVWAGISAFYLIGTVVTALSVAAWVPNDGESWQRFFERFEERAPAARPGAPRISTLESGVAPARV